MLTFFRRIRKGLLSDGRTSKYLLYASGEVLLVMIGILLALQVNNWNEARKDRRFEMKVLSDILTDSEIDLIRMSDASAALARYEQSYNIILNHLINGIPYHDSLDIHFARSLLMWSSDPNTTAFEMAKAEGLYLIRSDSIRIMVSNSYVFRLNYIKVLENRWHDYSYNVALPHCSPLFEYTSIKRMPPLDYCHLLSDSVYINILRTISEMRQYYLERLTLRYESHVKLNKLIREDLKG